MAERGTESTKLDVAAEDLETGLIQTKVASAEELQGKADKYPDPPETTDFPGDLATYQKHMQAYLIQRADILGIVMESCKRCRSGGCKIDISCFLSGQRFKKRGACYKGKCSCTNSAEAERLFLKHQRYLRMNQKNTIEYQNLQARIAAQAARERSQTRDNTEQTTAARHVTLKKSTSLPEEDMDSSIAYLRVEADGLASIADIGSGHLKLDIPIADLTKILSPGLRKTRIQKPRRTCSRMAVLPRKGASTNEDSALVQTTGLCNAVVENRNIETPQIASGLDGERPVLDKPETSMRDRSRYTFQHRNR